MPDTSGEGKAVDVEDPLTWPVSLCELLAKSRDTLSRFEERRAEIDSVRGVRFTRTNEFANERSAVVEKAEQILAHETILGFHCTRLLRYEVESIKANGLRLPSPHFLSERISRAVDEGYLTREIAERLLGENQAADPNRCGAIGFANAPSLLKQEHLVCRFFQSWGGEALYNLHEDDPTTGQALRTMGQPYIIVAALPRRALCVPGYLADFFIGAFLQSIGIEARYAAAFESSVNEQVPPDWLRRIIGPNDPQYAILTCSRGLKS